MGLLLKDFIKQFETYCPQELAETGDPVGLHFGSMDQEINKVMLTLDVRPDTIKEAIENNVDLIVAKHPPIFRSVKRLVPDNPQTKMYTEIIKHDIAVYAAHTNLDIVDNGLNDWFCEELGIKNTTYLTHTHSIPEWELSVMATDEEELRLVEAAISQDFTCYPTIVEEMEGELVVGTFKVLEFAKQSVETKLKELFNKEPMDYAWEPMASTTADFGIGRIGELDEEVSLEDFVQTVKQSFNLDGLRLTTDSVDKKVKRVAICGGSGEKFYPDAVSKKADVYLTGDVYYHTGHDMIEERLSVIDPGHHIEVLCQPRLRELCEQWKEAYNWDLEFVESSTDTNPFKYY